MLSALTACETADSLTACPKVHRLYRNRIDKYTDKYEQTVFYSFICQMFI